MGNADQGEQNFFEDNAVNIIKAQKGVIDAELGNLADLAPGGTPLEAAARLGDAARSLERLKSAAETLSQFEEGLVLLSSGDVADQLRGFGDIVDAVTDLLPANIGLIGGAFEDIVDRFVEDVFEPLRDGLEDVLDGQEVGDEASGEDAPEEDAPEEDAPEEDAPAEDAPATPSPAPFFSPLGFFFPSMTPLIVDLDGDGVETISLEESGVFFDLNEDGFAELTGFVAPDDALLALDRNGDGIINSNAELFGSTTEDGFQQLSLLDSNNDGIIDADDDQFSDLVLFQDINSNGITNEGELIELSDVGLESISLDVQQVSEINQGNSVLLRSTATFSDGRIADVDDVFFENNQSFTQFIPDENFDFSIDAILLPLFKGYGQLADSIFVFSNDENLASEAISLVGRAAEGDLNQFIQKFENFFLDLNNAADIDPASRSTDDNGNAQHLVVLENLFGTGFVNPFGGNTFSGPVNANQIAEQYQVALEFFAARFLVQSSDSAFSFGLDIDENLANALELLSYDPGTDRIVGDLEQFIENILVPIGNDDNADVGIGQAVEVLRLIRHDFIDTGHDFAALLEDGLARSGIDVGLQERLINDITRPIPDVTRGTTNDDIFSTAATGNDTYVFGIGFGNDTIQEGVGSFNFNNDRVRLDGLERDDVTLTINSESINSLVITIIATGETLTITDHFVSQASGIEFIEFDDGAVLDRAQIVEQVLAVGTDGDDVITGTSRNETFDGGAGNDVLNGSSGSDSYIFGVGSGNDVINESGFSFFFDRVILEGLNPDDVTFSFSLLDFDDLVITINETGETLLVNEHFPSASSGIELIQFADGTTLNRSQIEDQAILLGSDGDDIINTGSGDDVAIGGAGNDIIAGSVGDDFFDGGEGVDTLDFTYTSNDVAINLSTEIVTVGAFQEDILNFENVVAGSGDNVITGNELDNFLDGGAGTDNVFGDAGNDTLSGGAGFDFLFGGAGDDLFLFTEGSDQEWIRDFSAGAGSEDVVQVSSALFTDFNSLIDAAVQSGTRVVINTDGSEQLTFSDLQVADLHQDDFTFV